MAPSPPSSLLPPSLRRVGSHLDLGVHLPLESPAFGDLSQSIRSGVSHREAVTAARWPVDNTAQTRSLETGVFVQTCPRRRTKAVDFGRMMDDLRLRGAASDSECLREEIHDGACALHTPLRLSYFTYPRLLPSRRQHETHL